MQGFTDREKQLAVAAGGPPAGFAIALAELSMFWDSHLTGAPDLRNPVINIRIPDEGSPEGHIAAVEAIARWLGVNVDIRNGCWIAQRRFGMDSQCITVEAHYTPDPARAHFERLAAKEAAEERRELKPVAA